MKGSRCTQAGDVCPQSDGDDVRKKFRSVRQEFILQKEQYFFKTLTKMNIMICVILINNIQGFSPPRRAYIFFGSLLIYRVMRVGAFQHVYPQGRRTKETLCACRDKRLSKHFQLFNLSSLFFFSAYFNDNQASSLVKK